jgi:simple sugar transport system permease protein
VKEVGDHPRASDSRELIVSKVRYTAVIIGGAFAGLSGAFMSIAYMFSFSDTMIAGRGFIAVAVVVFARWNPLRAMVGSCCWNSLRLTNSLSGNRVRSESISSHASYLVTIIALISVSKKA